LSHYTGLQLGDFFRQVGTEEQAREFFWTARFDGKPFECPRCCHARFYEIGFWARIAGSMRATYPTTSPSTPTGSIAAMLQTLCSTAR